jgi:hypothetical protein
MRISTWLRLAVLGLIAGNLAVSSSLLTAGHNRHRPTAEPKKPLLREEFTGYGKTDFAAQRDALKSACAWLKNQSGLDWSPDPEYLLTHNMVQFGEPEDKKFEEPMLEGVWKVVKMQLTITDDQVRDFQKQAQHQRMKERQKQALLILLGAMGLLGVVGGYLRLEEATKGYYTRLLRIAAIGILVAILAGLCVAG